MALQAQMRMQVREKPLYRHRLSPSPPRLDMRPPARLAARAAVCVAPTSKLMRLLLLLFADSSIAPRRLLLRGAGGAAPPVNEEKLEPLALRCLGIGSMLDRRPFIALAGRDDMRRALGLSSLAFGAASSASSHSSGRGVRRVDADMGVLGRVDVLRDARGALPFAGVVGGWSVDATGRRGMVCVADAERVLVVVGGDTFWLRGLRTGMADWLDALL